MLTPFFEITQDDTFIFILIKAPYAQISDAEIFIEDCEFKFFAKPYYLRLNLPAMLVEDGRETAKYICDEGKFEVKVPKQKKGEFFEGLDLISKLLTPTQGKPYTVPSIEVLQENKECHSAATNGESEEDFEFDWQIDQVAYSEPDLSSDGPKYGFANQKSKVFARLQSEFPDLIDLKNADCTPWKDRREMREAAEREQFDADHYMADYCDDDEIQSLITFQPVWQKDQMKAQSLEFTEAEREKMMKFPCKEYLLDENCLQIALMSLVDILFAYTYNHITTQGENTVESGWTICKLSSTLSWLDIPKNLKDVVKSCFRRSLSYPLYRNWELSCKVFQHLCLIFSAGRRRILKCLLEVHSILSESDQRYVLNDLYITDYCVWIQSVRENHLESLTKYLKQICLKKVDLELELEELERTVVSLQDEGPNVLTEGLSSLKLMENENCQSVENCEGEEENISTESSEDSSDSSDTESSQTDTSSEESDLENKCTELEVPTVDGNIDKKSLNF